MAILNLLNELASALITHASAAAFNPCPVAGFPCPTATFFPTYVGKIAQGIAGATLGIATGVLIFYSLKLTVSGADESSSTEVRNSYLHVIFGAVLVVGASFIAAMVPATSAVAAPGSMIASILVPMKNFFFFMVGAALTINIAFQGARLITAQDDSAAGSARQGLIKGIIGLTAVLLAGVAVNAFGFDSITGAPIAPSNVLFGTELTGIGSFIITIFGALSVACIVVAGFFLVVSGDEQLKDRSKKIIITTAVAIIVVMASYTILSIFF
ncbi:MAG: hypothetical protein Greene041662_423 [Candidatus Peregrinibacteria bacterium Greene0416_62]|nr:MAG: hypothetical protein Greene041662_423 [Candidatus Peregrinibacteria bacterium Greene0416_62]TSD00375.1 MAG: hypothetical protein Greene101449_174 [Candidatus Peregrinibacteria bacterium Greene1014_49]